MVLTQKELIALKQDVARIEHEIKDKEDILAYYRREPSMKRHIPGLENQITGLKRARQQIQNTIQKG